MNIQKEKNFLEKIQEQIKGQDKLVKEVTNVFKIFKTSNCEIRPHFIVTGGSGCGKTHTISTLAKCLKMNFIEINCASLTKEGTSGNSLSKALTPLLNNDGSPTIVFCDEFDKLFISGNSNSDLAHETTNGVQNEFLKVLESPTIQVFSDYGKYISASTKNCLFVFAGAFNGQQDITISDLRDFGVKTEFIGRVGLCFNAKKLYIEDLIHILNNSYLIDKYLDLYEDIERSDVISTIEEVIRKNYEKNTIGARQINTLINQYFILGGKLNNSETKKTTFTKKLTLN